MLIYVNGDSHAAGAEAVNSYCFAEDDSQYRQLGRRAHPDNEEVCWGTVLGNSLKAVVLNHAESASSNDRILRTTKEHIEVFHPNLVIIGWSSWEREEWYEAGRYWQVNAAPPGEDWPKKIRARHRDWVMGIDYQQCMKMWHERIWDLHCDLQSKKIPHLFFNCFSEFKGVKHKDWGQSYLGPYDSGLVYQNWLKDCGFSTVNPKSYHFGPQAHQAWADVLLKQLTLTLLQ